jgi:S1-C subfamily serine protease
MKGKDMRMMIVLLALGIAGSACAQAPAPSDGSTRKVCQSMEHCTDVTYQDALALTSTPMPPAVEKSFAQGYVFIEVSMKTTGGMVERGDCGGFIIDELQYLVVTAQHCLPPYAGLVKDALKADGIPARHVASIPESDLALLKLERLPDGKGALPYKEAVVGEAVYGRSIQRSPFTNTPASKTVNNLSFFMGPVTFYGSVSAKGTIGVGKQVQRNNGSDVSYDIETTVYQALRIRGDAEPGFSGSPIYNEWGEVVAILSGGMPGMILAGSAKDFPALISKMKE